MKHKSTSLALTTGFVLLAICMPLGLTLEALHAMKWRVYLESEMRREMWTLAHAHGNLLGLLLLVWAGLGARAAAREAPRARITKLLVAGAVLMPLGFFAGGVLSSEGDPSLGILLVPAGAAALLVGLVFAALAERTETP